MARLKWSMPLVLLACGAAQAESIPLIHEHGTYQVPVVINDKISLNFTLDSGASDVSIPADVFSTLTRTGTITKSDLLDTQVYELADGSEHQSQRFRIRSLRIGNLELRDVTCSVAPAAGSLLLGQSFLERLDYWSIDNQRHLLIVNQTPSSGFGAPKTPHSTGSPKQGPTSTDDQSFMLRMNLPAGWSSKPPSEVMTRKGWSIYAQNRTAGIELALSSIGGQTPMNFLFARNARTQGRLNFTDEKASEVSEIWVNGRHAYRFSITGKTDKEETLTYLYTFIQGSTDIAELMAWTTPANFDNQKDAIEALSGYVVGLQ